MIIRAAAYNPLLTMLILYLPAYVSNAVPVLVRNGTPIDRGKVLSDGRRILGDGKTVEGFILGLLFGSQVGLIEMVVFMEPALAAYGLLASLGALLGDMAGSFVKRRLGIKRGDPAPLLDQLDFVIGASALMVIAGLHVPLEALVLALLITPVLHVASNIIAFKLGLKDRPW